MKRALVLLLGALALFPVAGSAATSAARVAITDLTPFTVHGTGFQAHETITVTVDANRHVVRTTTANAAGAFTARFSTIHPETCSAYSVRVHSSHGTTVSKKIVPECAPPAGGGGGAGEDPAPLNPTDPRHTGK